jgi:hypothetical protein
MSWESTIPTYGLSKILQVSCHRCNKAIKIATKYVWSFIVRENKRSTNLWWWRIKATNYIINVAITRGNITWRSFAIRVKCIQHWKRMATSASHCEGPIFYFYASVKVILSIPFYFIHWQASCGGERSRHICPVECGWAWVIIVDITLEVNKLESLSSSLSGWNLMLHMYGVSVSNYERLNDSWVCGLAKRLLHVTLPESTMNCNCVVDWEHSLLAFKKVYASYFNIVVNCYLLMRSLW